MQRYEPYSQYFEYILPLWKFVKTISWACPNFKKSKKEFKDMVITCMVINEPIVGENGESIEPTEKINSE